MKKRSKKINYRNYALEYFGRQPEATDNILLALLIANHMEWEKAQTMVEVKKAIKFFYHVQKPKKKRSPKKTVDFYSSKAWKTLRYQALLKHGGTCHCCGAMARDGVQIHVDHILPRSKYPEFELDLNNLQILCGDCNIGKDNIDETNWKAHWDNI